MGGYDEDLAHVHDRGFGHVAEAAAGYVLTLLPAHAAVVELGCGSGITARRLVDAGHEVLGIDQSPALIALARERAPAARFRVGSFVTEPLPRVRRRAGDRRGPQLPLRRGQHARRAARPVRPHPRRAAARRPAAVRPRRPGRHGGDGRRHFSAGPDWAVLVEYREQGDVLVRHITTFVERGGGYRRGEEVHRQRLYRPAEILPLLRTAGLKARNTRGYSPGPGRHVYLARKPR